MEDNLADVLSIREGVEPYAAANMIYTLRIMPKSKYCEERVTLGQKISRAVLAVYSARQVDLEAARQARYDALKALQEHVKWHRCYSGPLK